MKWYVVLLVSCMALACSEDNDNSLGQSLLGGLASPPAITLNQGTGTERVMNCNETQLCSDVSGCQANALAQYRCVPTGSNQPAPQPMAGMPTAGSAPPSAGMTPPPTADMTPPPAASAF